MHLVVHAIIDANLDMLETLIDTFLPMRIVLDVACLTANEYDDKYTATMLDPEGHCGHLIKLKAV